VLAAAPVERGKGIVALAGTSLVHELQALAQASETDLGELLRRAKVVAAKLQLGEFDGWISNELNGYPPGADLPGYRKVASELKFFNPVHGFRPVVFDDDLLHEYYSTTSVSQPIGEIAALSSKEASGILTVSLGPNERTDLVRLAPDLAHYEIRRTVSRSGVVAILDAVRNRILQWSLDLERNRILGEGMTFSKDERSAAATIATINNYGSIVQGNHAAVAIASGENSQAVGQFQQQVPVKEIAELRELVALLKDEAKRAPVELQGEVVEHVEDLEEETQKAKPKASKMKAAIGAIAVAVPWFATNAPKAVEAIERIKHLLGK
jgi:hypothetical protein